MNKSAVSLFVLFIVIGIVLAAEPNINGHSKKGALNLSAVTNNGQSNMTPKNVINNNVKSDAVIVLPQPVSGYVNKENQESASLNSVAANPKTLVAKPNGINLFDSLFGGITTGSIIKQNQLLTIGANLNSVLTLPKTVDSSTNSEKTASRGPNNLGFLVSDASLASTSTSTTKASVAPTIPPSDKIGGIVTTSQTKTDTSTTTTNRIRIINFMPYDTVFGLLLTPEHTTPDDPYTYFVPAYSPSYESKKQNSSPVITPSLQSSSTTKDKLSSNKI